MKVFSIPSSRDEGIVQTEMLPIMLSGASMNEDGLHRMAQSSVQILRLTGLVQRALHALIPDEVPETAQESQW